jgi:acyl carrier protein
MGRHDAGLVRNTLRDFLRTLRRCGGEPRGDANLLAEGVISSLQLMELIAWVEDTWRVRVRPRDLFDGRLSSVDSIVDYILAAA